MYYTCVYSILYVHAHSYLSKCIVKVYPLSTIYAMWFYDKIGTKKGLFKPKQHQDYIITWPVNRKGKRDRDDLPSSHIDQTTTQQWNDVWSAKGIVTIVFTMHIKLATLHCNMWSSTIIMKNQQCTSSQEPTTAMHFKMDIIIDS